MGPDWEQWLLSSKEQRKKFWGILERMVGPEEEGRSFHPHEKKRIIF